MTERQGSGIREQGSDTHPIGPESHLPLASDRMRELEVENARLKTLVGELLVENQLLRGRVNQNPMEK